MSKKNRHEYYRGKPGVKYGIYNTSAKCFQFGISEDTPALAQARLFQKIGDDAHKWRFEPRALPPDGLRANVTIIDEMLGNTGDVHLYYSQEDAALLFDLLHDELEHLQSAHSADWRSGGTILTQEERDYLRRASTFCAEQVLALAKYADIGDIEG